MQKWKKIGKKLLFPPVWIIVILTILSTLALVCIFVKGWELTLIAYISYVVSFYTLVVLCIACWKVLPGYYKVTKNKLHNNKYIDRYMGDVVFKTTVVLYRSLGINLMYVVVNIISACVYETNWFGVFAVYYAIIAVMRFLLVCYVKKNKIGNNYLGVLKRARVCAYILMTVNLVLSGAILMMVFFDRGFHYQGFIIYVIALYTFYITITAIMDMMKYRRYKSPIMSVTKVIKMTEAMFSMLFLETAMFAQFGADTSEKLKRIMIMATGAGICVVVVFMSIYMIIQTSRKIKQVRSKEKNGK